MRGGPGLGNIAACQSDYFQMTRSAGHGDFRPLTLAPATIQEAIDLTGLAVRSGGTVPYAGDPAGGRESGTDDGAG
jgi:pyruvate/2-oxoacid:ferredoxin oxidoreductase alpha subunit